MDAKYIKKSKESSNRYWGRGEFRIVVIIFLYKLATETRVNNL